MPVFRINKNKNYTVMSNYHLRDKKLSFKAKGLLSYMLSLPDNWDYSLRGLCLVSKDNEASIRTALKELKTLKYLEVTKERDEKGRFVFLYNIYENPHAIFHTGLSTLENPVQINTKEEKTKNKEKINKKKSFQNFEQREYSQEELDKLYANNQKNSQN